MRKYLYLLPLLALILIPKNVFAFVVPPNDYKNYYIYPTGITDEQKQFMLDSVQNDEDYISYSQMYPYQIIIYKTGSIPFQYNYAGHYILVIYFENIPNLTNLLDQYMTIENSTQSKIVSYKFDLDNNTYTLHTNNFSKGVLSLFNFNSNHFLEVGENGTYLASYLDFFLYSNFNLKPLWNFNLYNLDGTLIKTYTIEDDLFNFDKEEEKEYTIEDILSSDDVLYSLSKELIGPLPEEFNFIYSIVSLMLGILVLTVIISPFVLLKRWLM